MTNIDELMHYGTLHKSGRYPWGSGETPYQRSGTFLSMVADLEAKGLSPAEVAKGLGLDSTTQLRANKQIAKNEIRKQDAATALKLKDKGMSNVAIGSQMGMNESSIRALLAPAAKLKDDILATTAAMLRDHVASKRYLDIGAGTENHLGISKEKLNTAVAILREEGYRVDTIKVPQLGTSDRTTMKVLSAPDVTYSELQQNQKDIKTVTSYSEDGGRTFLGIEPPVSVNSKRIAIRYGDEGGSDKDGVIELRPGVDDISLGQARYAQVRIAVDGTHYLKGMAMYSTNLPDGVDMVFNTNKSKKANKLDAMKPMKDDPDNPFGSVIRQKHYVDAKGKTQLSPLNIVGSESPDGDSSSGEEGGWSNWSGKLSSQFLSKQTPALAKQQLNLTYNMKNEEFEEIQSLTNPAVKKRLLAAFADGVDSSAVHLKAAGLPRTAAHVILPINSLKDSEIYAPNYNNGEKVVLVRHPHGGIFEIPELTVNNRNKEANTLIQGARDAVGINSKVAARLSGADFDGDTVLVIPNNSRSVKTSAPLAGLKDFDPQRVYPAYDGMKTIDGGTWNGSTGKVDYGVKGPSSRTKQHEMGNVSNLITDMTIKDATTSEIARAVRHSMVVIDSEKHSLNYKQSAKDNGIADLKAKYQGGSNRGASTLISKAKSTIRVAERKDRSASAGGAIDPETGEKMYEPTTNSTYTKNGQEKTRTTKTTKMAETKDAYSLSSGTPIEAVYADHANKLKALANTARKAYLKTPNVEYNSSANKAYASEVQSLNAKLNVALKNAPLERQAQLFGNATLKQKRLANPDMEADEIKKIKGQALVEARNRVGAKKDPIVITPPEWNAIQAGAITNNKLNSILNNTNLDQIKLLATPRDTPVMTSGKIARAQSMLASGYTLAEIASALGVSTSTISSALK